MSLKEYAFEIYTLNPNTNETGWDIINNCVVVAETMQEARVKLKEYPLFDCVILFNYACEDIDDRIDDINAIYNKDINYVKIWEFDSIGVESNNDEIYYVASEKNKDVDSSEYIKKNFSIRAELKHV